MANNDCTKACCVVTVNGMNAFVTLAHVHYFIVYACFVRCCCWNRFTRSSAGLAQREDSADDDAAVDCNSVSDVSSKRRGSRSIMLSLQRAGSAFKSASAAAAKNMKSAAKASHAMLRSASTASVGPTNENPTDTGNPFTDPLDDPGMEAHPDMIDYLSDMLY